MLDNNRLGASFRDPSGFLFTQQGTLYRQINQFYREDYERLMSSGLYDELVGAGLLISHEEVNVEPAAPSLAYKIIRPEPLRFVSYPYEWCFSQLKDAALVTLKIQKRALSYGMSLKDSSAYNIQFFDGRPVLVDTLSFESYREGEPWVAYRQFCQHFIAPLALMAHRDVRLSQLLRVYIDGVPLDLASRLLPLRTWFNLSLLSHIHLHAKAQRRYANKPVEKSAVKGRMSRNAFLGLMDTLESVVRQQRWKPVGTEWEDYYSSSSQHYTSAAVDHKRHLVSQFLARIQPSSVWDLGANTGLFSRIASEQGIPTIAFDVDPGAVEQNYLDCVLNKESNLLPLIMDLTNPSPSLGWHNQERSSFLERSSADAILALALIHHLAISNNVPLDRLASFFRQLSKWLIIEFVPKADSQVQRLLATREDIFSGYDPENFEKIFGHCYTICESVRINGSPRTLYLMQAR